MQAYAPATEPPLQRASIEPLRVALVCPTIGQTQRGYERYFSDLFRFLRDRIDITLYKGAGSEGAGERVVPHASRTGVLQRLCAGRARYWRYHIEFASFALAMAPDLRRQGYNLVHFIDPALGPHFSRIRSALRLPFRLLFSNAGPISFDASRWVDHVHCLSPLAFEEAEQLGLARERLSLVPMGVDAGALRADGTRREIRERLGLTDDQFVVLAIASVNRAHKRVDYLIEEVAAMNDDTVLWLDGSLHPDGDPELLRLGERLLGERFRYSHLRSEQVPGLLRMADLFVSAATYESFGMAVSEAMAAGLPVLVHDSEHFRWLTGQHGHRIDMSKFGNLTGKLAELRARPTVRQANVDQTAVLHRFGWPEVAAMHLDMYERVVAGNRN